MPDQNPHTLDYAPPPAATAARRRRRAFWFGFAAGEVLSLLLISILAAGGPIFPVNVFFPHTLLIGEAFPGAINLIPDWQRPLIMLVNVFVLAPALYGLYAALCIAPRSKILITLAMTSHLALFLLVAYLRDAFR
jgi:hypothetical protein